MKNYIEKIRLNEERELLSYMEEAFNAPAINSLISFQDQENKDRFWSDVTSGFYVPLSPRVGERLYALTQEIIGRVDYTERPITFYIRNDSEFNACAIFNHNEDEPHYILFNSALVDKLTDNEMKFIIGHELGHLMYEHSVFSRIVDLIYPDASAPPFLSGLYALWANLNEISADRMGMLAVNNFETAISAMFKMSSGVDMASYQVSMTNFMEINEALVREMSTRKRQILMGDHPVNPVRIKAIEAFRHSTLYRSLLDEGRYVEDQELDEKTDKLIDLLRKYPENDTEQAKLDFLAAAGYHLIGADEEIVPEEYDELMNILSVFHYWPPFYVKSLIKENDPMEIIDRSASYIVENCSPHDVCNLFEALIPLVTRDRHIRQQEIDALMLIAEKLKFSGPEAVKTILEGIRYLYKPLS
ncbi:MAG TPA: M48 family metallopeptidase [Smithellaceae bacterium]|nr:M48 family metallopeptidase [Smithellaceae bacterium]